MKQTTILMLILASFFGQMYAQTDTTESGYDLDVLHPIVDPLELALFPKLCASPTITANTVVNYEGFANVRLKFASPIPLSQVSLKNASNGNLSSHALANSTLILNNLTPNTLYYVIALDECGVANVIGLIDTKEGEKEVIEVSPEVFEMLKQHGESAPTMTLKQFANLQPNVDNFDKLALYQQFYNKGKKIPAFVGGDPNLLDNDTIYDCECKLFKTAEVASPSNQINGEVQGVFNTDYVVKYPMSPRSSYWQARISKGAAKYHQLWTEGRKAAIGEFYEKTISYSDSLSTSSQQTKLWLNFYCNDGKNLASKCNCDKKVDIFYRYDTRIKAHAERLSGWLQTRRAHAQVEDWATVVLREETNPPNFKVLGSVSAKAAALCERNINPAFWTNWLNAAGQIGKIVLPFYTGTDSAALSNLLSGVDGALSAIGTVINTPYYQSAICNADAEQNKSLEGIYTHYLKPNTPIQVTVNSYNKLYAGGQRSWFSHARITSDNYLGLFLYGAPNDNVSRNCCSPNVISWVAASCDGPLLINDLKKELGSAFWTIALGSIGLIEQSGVHYVPSEYGYNYEYLDKDGCDKIEVNPRNALSNADGLLNNISTNISVFDFSGKLVTVIDSKHLWIDLDKNLKLNLENTTLPIGMYVAQFQIDNQPKTLKFFISSKL